MATYFHGNPEIQGDENGLQTLLLINPTYVQHNHNHNHHLSSPPQPHHQQQFVGIPLPNCSAAPSHDSNEIPAAFHALINYNLYNNNISHAPSSHAQQELSLSLSSQQQQDQGYPATGWDSTGSGVKNGMSGLQGMLLSSKYLKTTQELLAEVVNVNGNGIKSNGNEKENRESSVMKIFDGSGGGEVEKKQTVPELNTAERQESQMKKAKLVNMLDEVQQRYRQYHHQMQIVVSIFEQAAGIGAAKTYTALALKTISKQFRCLKDTITAQIRAASNNLGEDDVGNIEGSRLRFVDNHFRRQHALQQMGMIQQNTWRPQRGLPERSVTVLRAWLFEHFLHPYPKDSDKHFLANQTGLTRSQVSNWFINARVRLWKPMVEEMYLEEIKEQEQSHGSDGKISDNTHNGDSASKPTEKTQSISFKTNDSSVISTTSTSPIGENLANESGFSFIGSTELHSPKRRRTSEMIQPTPYEANNEQLITMEFNNGSSQGRDEFLFIRGQNNFVGGYNQNSISDTGRFDAEQFTPMFSGNGVSLTLGLHQQPFLPNQNIQLGRRMEMVEPNEYETINSSASHSSTVYDDMELQNRKRFVTQLLPDFVAL